MRGGRPNNGSLLRWLRHPFGASGHNARHHDTARVQRRSEHRAQAEPTNATARTIPARHRRRSPQVMGAAAPRVGRPHLDVKIAQDHARVTNTHLRLRHPFARPRDGWLHNHHRYARRDVDLRCDRMLHRRGKYRRLRDRPPHGRLPGLRAPQRRTRCEALGPSARRSSPQRGSAIPASRRAHHYATTTAASSFRSRSGESSRLWTSTRARPLSVSPKVTRAAIEIHPHPEIAIPTAARIENRSATLRDAPPLRP